MPSGMVKTVPQTPIMITLKSAQFKMLDSQFYSQFNSSVFSTVPKVQETVISSCATIVILRGLNNLFNSMFNQTSISSKRQTVWLEFFTASITFGNFSIFFVLCYRRLFRLRIVTTY